jgi:DNA-binding NarL/FixJ family response regulator
MTGIRVLLADDHQTVLDRVRGLLATDFDIIGAVNNGRDAVAEAERLDPDVVVIDISMPIVDGLQAADHLRAKNRRASIIFLTVHKDRDFVDAALSAGASGYVNKAAVTTDLIPAIHEALLGRIYISRSITP